MAKRRKPTPEYLEELREEALRVQDGIAVAQNKLYMSLLEGKLFQPEFEEAREYCLILTSRLEFLEKEYERVDKALLKLPELPFEE